MVDPLKLERRPLKGLYTQEGFECQQCHRWKPCWISTRQLDEKMRKLENMRPDHPSFMYLFVKVLKRAEEIQRRGTETDGSIRHQNMVASG